MHSLEIHLQAVKGDQYAELGEEGSCLVTHYLVINGKDIGRKRQSRDEDPTIRYAIRGEAPTGFCYLEVYDPPHSLVAMFSPDEILFSEHPNVLKLPLRKIEFVRYGIPPPLTELERENAELPL